MKTVETEVTPVETAETMTAEQSVIDSVQMKQKIFDRRENLKGTPALIDYEQGTSVRLIVKENSKKPGKIIFVREDGKVGFPTINSIHTKIGDVVEGKIKVDNKSCFFVEVDTIVQRAITTDAQA